MKVTMPTIYSMALSAICLSCWWIEPALATCPSTPDTACKFAGAASFTYRNASDDQKDKLGFKLSKGAPTNVNEFGSPTTTDTYDLCIYAAGALASGMAVGADGDCSDSSCWTIKAKGPIFKDKSGTPDGITGIKLATSSSIDESKTKVGVSGKGVHLGDMTIPLVEPIAVQLRNSLGHCWGAIFAGGEQVAQDSTKGKAKMRVKTEVLPSCSDSLENGWESDVDCGGSCFGCGFTKSCNYDGDCVSGSCIAGSCAAGCSDGVKNGDESDVDCGGSCGSCAFGRTCASNSDCGSNLCRNGQCSEKLVFVTSTSYAGNFGGLTAADTGCNDRAAAAGLGSTWTAWLSDSTHNAIDRIVDQQYFGMDGYVAFANKAQISSTSRPTWGIARNEFNGDAGPYQAWTGTRNSGTANSPNCLNWTTNSNLYQGWIGWPGTPINWSAYGSIACNNPYHLICFEN